MLFTGQLPIRSNSKPSFRIGDNNTNVEAACNLGIDGYLLSGDDLDVFVERYLELRK